MNVKCEERNTEMINSSVAHRYSRAMSWEFLNGLPFESNLGVVCTRNFLVGRDLLICERERAGENEQRHEKWRAHVNEAEGF
jgi:hypothetical protein